MRLIFKKHLLKKLGGLILAFLVSTTTKAYVNMTGKIDGFDLNLCGLKSCIRIESNQAFTSGISPGYALSAAVISLIHTESKNIRRLVAEDIFFDSRTDKIFIRKITEYKNTEAIYDLATEQLSLYHKDQNQ